MTIKVFSEELPESIPWDSAAVRYVVEASGMFTSYDKASVRRIAILPSVILLKDKS